MADWNKLGSSGNVEDRRSIPFVGGVGSLGIVGALIWAAFTYFATGGDLSATLDQLGGAQIQNSFTQSDLQFSSEYPKFASAVLGSNNDLWKEVFSKSGKTYTEPKLVLFRSGTQSACGVATSDIGPHYCPEDSTIYLDETFFDELQKRFKAKGGDVAEAYVISHEVGHHVQNQLGLLSAGESNADSVKTELQADCFAGVWAYSVNKQGVFEPGEVNEALDAAAAVGDDRIQKAINGRVNKETWTHGSSADRTKWFSTGYDSGDPALCTP